MDEWEQDWAFPFCRTARSFERSGFGFWQNDFLQALSFCDTSAGGGGVQSVARLGAAAWRGPLPCGVHKVCHADVGGNGGA